MAGHVFWACCGEPPTGSAAYFVAPLGQKPAQLMHGERIEQAPVSLPRELSVARHEAAHGVVSLICGGRIESLTIDGQAIAYTPDVPDQHRALVYLAGDAATEWHSGRIARVDDNVLADWLAGIRNCGGGSCDRCRAVRHSVVATRHASDDVILADIRRNERLAGLLVRMPQVWAAICAIAARLMAAGSLDGATATAIALSHFSPAALRPFLS